MKLTVFFLLLTVIQVLGFESYSQETKISLNFKSTSLKEILASIENESDFYFLYSSATIDVDRKVDADIKKGNISEVLDEILKDTGIRYVVKGRQILLLNENSQNDFFEFSQQATSVSGKVTDSSGAPLPGVTVVVKGTTQGTITDSNGFYSLPNVARDATLVFSFVGMKTKELAVSGRTVIDASLADETIGLEEVVAVGYGVQKRVNLTGAVSSIKSNELVTVTTPDIANNLTGKLPGLRVQTFGSEPGVYDNKIDIRGWGNMLIIVDGVPRDDFQRIDPTTIDNISILKDASAAVYGVKAANGVMLITTKKGEAGKSQVNLNASYGFEYITDYPRAITNSIDNLILKNEAALVAGNPLPYPDYLLYTGEDPNYPNVNYWDLTVRDYMPMNKNTLSFSGGSNKVTYFLSFGNLHQSGIYKAKSLNYDRYNLRANITAEVAKGLHANVILSGMADERNTPYGSSSYDFMKQVWMQPTYEPVYANNTPPYYYNGEADRNPVAIIDPDLTGSRQFLNKRFESTLAMTYDVPFIKGLKIRGLFAYDVKYQVQTIWRKAYSEYKYNATNDQYIQTGLHSPTRLQKYFDDWISTQTQLSLEYEKSFGGGNHNISAFLLLDRRDGEGDGFLGQRYYTLATIPQLNAGLTENQVASGAMKVINANMGLVGRLNYNYKSKYLTELSFRYDGSSLFPEDSRWGFFPGVQVGWRISEEPFIKDNFGSIDNLKLRFSHGVMGDDTDAGGFQYITGYTYPKGNYIFDGNTLISGSGTKGLANENLTWYEATTSNIGVDGTFWGGLLDITAELFQRKREGLLSTRVETLPAEFGANFPKENLDSDLSRGFELSVGHARRINDFAYRVRANVSFIQSKRLHFEQAAPANSYLRWRNIYEDRYMNFVWGYGYVGQFQNQEEINTAPVQNANGHAAYFPGDIRYEDWNEDGMIDDHDKYPISRNDVPTTYYGLDMSASWKGLSLNVLFQGAAGYTQTPTEQIMGPLPWGRNSLEIFLDRWHHEDPLDFSTPWIPGKYPVTRDGFGFAPNKEISPFWVKKVAYLRLKSVELGYSLPRTWVRKINAQEVRVFTNALDVFTWKSKGVLFDPERRNSGDRADYGYKYPVMASFNLGVNVTF